MGLLSRLDCLSHRVLSSINWKDVQDLRVMVVLI